MSAIASDAPVRAPCRAYFAPPWMIPWDFTLCPPPSVALSTSTVENPWRRRRALSQRPATPAPTIRTSVEITDGIGDLSVQDKRRSIQAVEWRSVPGGFREQLNDHHTQYNQAHPEHRRDIKLLPVDKQRRDADHYDAHAGPDRIRHAHRYSAHHQGQHPERNAVADDDQCQRQRRTPALDGFHGNGCNHFRANGNGQINVGGIHGVVLDVLQACLGRHSNASEDEIKSLPIRIKDGLAMSVQWNLEQ